MEVKVAFEDFDLEVEVEKAVLSKINELVGRDVRKVFKDNGIDYLSLTQIVNTAVEREVNRVVNERISKIDSKINAAIDKEVEGLAKVKVAKALADYHKITTGGEKKITQKRFGELLEDVTGVGAWTK